MLRILIGKPLILHRILPSSQGGKDNYDNLILVDEITHILIHAVNPDVIEQYMLYLKETCQTILLLVFCLISKNCGHRLGHILIHAVNPDVIEHYMKYIRKSKQIIEKLNKYRLKVGNERIRCER